jgi:hypothetical protein
MSRTAAQCAAEMLRHAQPVLVLEHFARGQLRRLKWWERVLVWLRLRKAPTGSAMPLPVNASGTIVFRRHLPALAREGILRPDTPAEVPHWPEAR